jgi:hypothetical protein
LNASVGSSDSPTALLTRSQFRLVTDLNQPLIEPLELTVHLFNDILENGQMAQPLLLGLVGIL